MRSVDDSKAADHLAVVRSARAAVSALLDVLDEFRAEELSAVLLALDELSAATGGARVAVTQAAEATGAVRASQCGSTTEWVRTHAPSLAAAGAGAVARTVRECHAPAYRDERRPVWEAVVRGDITPAAAIAIVSETTALRAHVDPRAQVDIIATLVDQGIRGGAHGVRRIRAEILARHGRPGELQALADAAAERVSLTQPVRDELGNYVYTFVADAEAMAVVEALIGPMCRPEPTSQGPDPRTSEQRRGQALVAALSRATAAVSPTAPKSILYLTMDLQDLQNGQGAGRTLGPADDATLLGPETVRKRACDGGVIPMILGVDKEILDVGQLVRTVPPEIIRALWRRDRQCTFPGCGTPAHWCDAHHIVHWVDGGPTSLDNTALLCARHHTIVHRDRLLARVTVLGVRWDVAPGSYDRQRAS